MPGCSIRAQDENYDKKMGIIKDIEIKVHANYSHINCYSSNIQKQYQTIKSSTTEWTWDKNTTWSKKGQSVYCFLVDTPGSASLSREVTALATVVTLAETDENRAGFKVRVKGRLHIALVTMRDLRCLLMSLVNSDQYLSAVQEVHSHWSCLFIQLIRSTHPLTTLKTF